MCDVYNTHWTKIDTLNENIRYRHEINIKYIFKLLTVIHDTYNDQGLVPTYIRTKVHTDQRTYVHTDQSQTRLGNEK